MKYKSRRPPRVKQAEALQRMNGKKVFALLMAMRTGKTKVILDDFGRLYYDGKADDLCIIAPLGALPPWELEVAKEWPDHMLKAAQVYRWNGRPTSDKAKKALKAFLDYRDGPRLLLLNIEALSTVDDAKDLVVKFAKQRKSVGCIDESTKVKNPTSKRTKFVCKMLSPHFNYKRIASGLITPRSPLDLYCQFYFLDKKILGHDSYFTFRARYAVLKRMDFGGRQVDVVVGYRDEARLRELIEPHSFRVRLEDCYDMPASVYEPVYVEMTPEQSRIYNELKNYATAKISGEAYVSSQIVIAQLLRMHQVLLGHTVDEEGVEHIIPENRTAALIDMLEEYDGKAIIWCSYDADVFKLTSAL
jgi:SNF2 family DNA or RNA helicase